MERFKVVERETKTKAYSKEGKILCEFIVDCCLILSQILSMTSTCIDSISK